MLSFKIIKMSEEHLDSIMELEKNCFSEPWSEKSLKEALKNNKAHFLVAVDDVGNVLGYVGFNYVYDEGYITNVAVFPQYRRCGVARKLLKTIIDFGYENNLKFISLEVRQSNIFAISLYNSLNFLSVGTRKGFYSYPKENAVIMTRYLK